jgi:protein-S-isoprenylcysteine O-methyltransferase Ste14
VLGVTAPLAVGADLVEPLALFDDPGVVVVGAGLLLLGTAVLLVAQSATAALRQAGADKVSARRGLYARVRHPGLAGVVVAMAGLLLMVPTLLAVLATVLLVVAVQIQARRVREPGLAERHGGVYAGYARRTGRFVPRVLPADGEGGLSDRHPGRTRVG